MYFTHSTTQQVLAWDYDRDSGTISNERVFYQHSGSGDPDGFRVDAEGNIWHAVYGEGRVLKISAEGKLVGQVRLPTRNATCVEFVGTELFVTTAADEDGKGESEEFGGGLFRVDVGVRGLEPVAFKMVA
jgi:sugar lactone lactonase YvrE